MTAPTSADAAFRGIVPMSELSRLGIRTAGAIRGWSKSSSEENLMPRPGLSQIWDMGAVLLLLPVVVLMGSQLPGDWKQHNGSGLPGNAVVVSVEPSPGGTRIVVDVSDESGRVVGRRQEVNGDAPHVLGAVFAVTYVPAGDSGMTQVYTAGHDPFRTSLLVFIPCAVVLLVGLARVGARLWKLCSRWRSRDRTGPYRAGHGYTRE